MRPEEYTAHIDNDSRDINLRSLLLTATSNLTPNSNYGLKLFGIAAPKLLMREFEQQFQRSVDLDKGLNLSLGYDVLEQAFSIRSLALSMEKGRSRGRLIKTDTLGFIPTVEVNGEPVSGYLPLQQWEDAELLRQTNITQPPQGAALEYSGWRSNLLRRTAGWILQESAEYIESHGERYEQRIRISNEERVGRDALTSTKTQSVQRTIDTHSEDGLESDSIHAVIELEVLEANQRLHTYHYLSKTERDPFILSDSKTTQIGNRERLDTRDDDVYFSYRNMLESTIGYIRHERDLSKPR